MALSFKAPLSPDIQKFIQTAACHESGETGSDLPSAALETEVLNAPTRQGYGLTETCAGSCVQFWGDSSTGSIWQNIAKGKVAIRLRLSLQ